MVASLVKNELSRVWGQHRKFIGELQHPPKTAVLTERSAITMTAVVRVALVKRSPSGGIHLTVPVHYFAASPALGLAHFKRTVQAAVGFGTLLGEGESIRNDAHFSELVSRNVLLEYQVVRNSRNPDALAVVVRIDGVAHGATYTPDVGDALEAIRQDIHDKTRTTPPVYADLEDGQVLELTTANFRDLAREDNVWVGSRGKLAGRTASVLLAGAPEGGDVQFLDTSVGALFHPEEQAVLFSLAGRRGAAPRMTAPGGAAPAPVEEGTSVLIHVRHNPEGHNVASFPLGFLLAPQFGPVAQLAPDLFVTRPSQVLTRVGLPTEKLGDPVTFFVRRIHRR